MIRALKVICVFNESILDFYVNYFFSGDYSNCFGHRVPPGTPVHDWRSSSLASKYQRFFHPSEWARIRWGIHCCPVPLSGVVYRLTMWRISVSGHHCELCRSCAATAPCTSNSCHWSICRFDANVGVESIDAGWESWTISAECVCDWRSLQWTDLGTCQLFIHQGIWRSKAHGSDISKALSIFSPDQNEMGVHCYVSTSRRQQ